VNAHDSRGHQPEESNLINDMEEVYTREWSMIDTTRWYFDILPVHPQPEQMESFTGYLTRLGEANRMGTIGELVIIASLKTSYQTSDAVKMLNDYSTLSFGILPISAVCSENALRATTLFHVGKNLVVYHIHKHWVDFFKEVLHPTDAIVPFVLQSAHAPTFRLFGNFFASQVV